jgi:uracil-DNA glycosylase
LIDCYSFFIHHLLSTAQILENIPNVSLILLIGQYAQRCYLKKNCKINLTETVKNYKEYLPKYLPLPHPSPRNQNWLKINPWFKEEVIPELQKEYSKLLLLQINNVCSERL